MNNERMIILLIPKNWDNTQAFDGSYEKLPAGGHVCKILSARVETTDRGSEQLVLALDISEGSNYDGFYARDFEDRKKRSMNAKWPCVYRQFTLDSDGNANPYFKGLIKCVEESNPGYKWNWQEASLSSKKIGMIFREEEYVNQKGGVSLIVRPAFARTVQHIRDGVEVPEIKRLEKPANSFAAPSGGYTQVPVDDDLPF